MRLPRKTLLFVLVALPACVTAKSRFEDAQRFEAEGRWTEAANAYLDSLERDRDFPGARDGAQRTGAKAVPWAMTAAQNLATAGNPIAAAERYRGIELLHSRAERYGVLIGLPVDYAEQRDAAFGAAIDSILAEAGKGDGEWERRIALLDKATKYRPDATRQGTLTRMRYDLLMRWGESEFAGAHFYTAHGIAGRAVAVYPDPQDARAASARALMERALRQGTVHVAVPKLWFGPDAAGRMSRGFLPSLNGTLQDEHLDGPPPFIVVVDPAAVRREMRQMEIDRELLSPSRAATIGKLVKADYAVAGYIATFEYADAGRETIHTVPTRDGQRATYTLIDGTRVLTITIRFSVVDVAARQVVGDGEVSVATERKSTSAFYDGDRRMLILAEAERGYFDRERRRKADREMERGAMRSLAEQYVAACYEKVLGVLR